MERLVCMGNCLLFAVLYRLAHPDARICLHRGLGRRRWAPHFCVRHGAHVLDFKSEHPGRFPLWFRGSVRRRSAAAYQKFL